jgi:predicted RNA polymerase sigma factor
MKLRKQRTTREASLDEDSTADDDALPKEVPDWAPNPERLYWASELRDILIKCLEELNPILRTIFVLRDIEGLTIDQTVEVLNVSQTAVKVRLWRARLLLRENLTKYFSKQTHLARAQLFPSGRRTGRILECLRNSMERTHSINVAESEMHAVTRTAATDRVNHCLNNA